MLVLTIFVVSATFSACGDSTTPSPIPTTIASANVLSDTSKVTTQTTNAVSPTTNPTPIASTTSTNTTIATVAVTTVTVLATTFASFQQKYKSQEAIDVLKAAGLEAEQVRPMTAKDYGSIPYLGVEALRFFVPSIGFDNGGRVLTFDNMDSLERTKEYYDELGRYNPAFYSWIFTVENLLVQINGKLPDNKAKQYEVALGKLGRVTSSSRNMPPNSVFTSRNNLKFKNVPTFPGQLEVDVPLRVSDSTLQSFKLEDAALKMYVSDKELDETTQVLDKALITAGYKYAVPGSSKLLLQNGSYTGFYTKQGVQDIFLIVMPTSNIVKEADLNDPSNTRVIDQVKNHTTLVYAVVATNVLQSLTRQGQNLVTPTVVATAIPVPTATPTPPTAIPVPATVTPNPPTATAIPAAVNTPKTSTGFVLEVDGTRGVSFKGSCLVFSSNGSSSSQDATGVVPATIPLNGGSYIGSCVIQNQGGSGQLKARLLKYGSLVAEGATSEAYGVVSVAGN